nr:aminopeptidase [Geomicrobium sp. JCM 19055]
MPDKWGVSGHVRITKPFNLNGQLIQGVTLYFQEGKVVKLDHTVKSLQISLELMMVDQDLEKSHSLVSTHLSQRREWYLTVHF